MILLFSVLRGALLLLAFSAGACGGSEKSLQGDRPATTNSSTASTNARVDGLTVDPAKLDAEILLLEKQAEKTPGDDAAQTALAAAYVRRADAFRQGRQYREAERDYQNALRHDPDNEDAQQGIADVAQYIDRGATGENGEPAPLPITPNAAATGDEESSSTTEPSPRKKRPQRP